MTPREVWKYPLRLGLNNVSMPLDARPLTAQIQEHTLTLWAEVDPTAGRVLVTIDVIGTGHPIPTGTAYLASVQDGPFVWHVYIPEEVK